MLEDKKLGTEKITALLISFSAPAVTGILINSVYNIADRIFIGRSAEAGASGLAGLTVAFPMMMVTMSLGMLFGVGGSVLFSVRLGEEKRDEAERILGNATLFLIVSGLLITLFGLIFLKPILFVFGASEATFPFAATYMRIILPGSVFHMLALGGNSFIRSDGRPNIAMLTQLIGCGINIILDVLLINVFRMGVAGAAVATLCGQVSSSVWVILYFCGRRCNIKFVPRHLRPDFKLLRDISATGFPSFVVQLAGSLSSLFVNRMLARYASSSGIGGDFAISGMGIIASLQTIIVLPIIGLSQGAAPIFGFNHGAGKQDRVSETLKKAMFAATLYGLGAFAVLIIFPRALTGVFSDDGSLADFSANAARLWFISLPVLGFQIISAAYFQATGRSFKSTFTHLIRLVVVFVPSAVIFPMFWGINGVFIAAPFSDLAAAALNAAFIFAEFKKRAKNPPPRC